MSAHPTEDLAVLALGALSSEESAPVRAHLLGCTRCAEEFAELGGTVSVLVAAGPDAYSPDPAGDPVDDDVSEFMLARLRRDMGAEPSRPRPRRAARTAGIAAALLVFAAAGGATLLSVQDDGPRMVAPAPAGGTVVLAGMDAATGVMGEATVEPAAGWVRVGLTVSGVEPGVPCRITLRTTTGERIDAGSWTTAAPGGARPVQAAAAVPVEDVAAVEIETFAGEPVLTLRA